MNGQNFWFNGQLLRKNSVAGCKKIHQTKFRLVFIHLSQNRLKTKTRILAVP